MSLNDNLTAIPRRQGGEALATEDVAEPSRPWSEASNNLYVKMVKRAWEDLVGPSRPIALDALKWLEAGCPFEVKEGWPDVLLVEEWGWSVQELAIVARERFRRVHG